MKQVLQRMPAKTVALLSWRRIVKSVRLGVRPIMALCLLLNLNLARADETAIELFWEDLLPKGYQLRAAAPVDHQQTDLRQLQPDLNAPVVAELDQKMVKIPGFVVPLDGDQTQVSELLLVPYFGACIHVPPPPPNQIIHVRFAKPVAVANIADAVEITGVLSTKGHQAELAQTGYSMQGISLVAFEP